MPASGLGVAVLAFRGTVLASLDVAAKWSLVSAIVVLIAAVLLVALWRIPRLQAGRVKGKGSESDRFQIENEARRTLVQVITGIGIVATVALTLYQANETRQASNRNLALATQSQVAERFAQAIEQLQATAAHKKSVAPRVGGIYTLAQLGESGQVDPASIADVLSAYVRAETPAGRGAHSPKASRGAFSSCAGNNLSTRGQRTFRRRCVVSRY